MKSKKLDWSHDGLLSHFSGSATATHAIRIYYTRTCTVCVCVWRLLAWIIHIYPFHGAMGVSWGGTSVARQTRFRDATQTRFPVSEKCLGVDFSGAESSEFCFFAFFFSCAKTPFRRMFIGEYCTNNRIGKMDVNTRLRMLNLDCERCKSKINYFKLRKYTKFHYTFEYN